MGKYYEDMKKHYEHHIEHNLEEALKEFNHFRRATRKTDMTDDHAGILRSCEKYLNEAVGLVRDFMEHYWINKPHTSTISDAITAGIAGFHDQLLAELKDALGVGEDTATAVDTLNKLANQGYTHEKIMGAVVKAINDESSEQKQVTVVETERQSDE